MKPWETPSRYAHRIGFVTGFDRFRSHSRISPDKERRLLLALYDYQEATLAVYRDMTKASGERFIRDEPYPDGLVYDMLMDTHEQFAASLDRILSPREDRMWHLYCAGCYAHLLTGERVLRLGDEHPRHR